MSSSNVIEYKVGGNTVSFKYPTLTVTETPVLAGRGNLTVSVRKRYAIRALVMVTSGSLDEKISTLYQVLSAPGGDLTINYNGWGNELNVDADKDLRGGPRPANVAITKIHGGNAALVRWEVEVETYPTPSGYNGDEGKWVDLVYTISTKLDQSYYAVRSISGVMRLNKHYLDEKHAGVDAFRETLSDYFAIPSEEMGFWQRIRQDFETSADNTKMKFTFVDKQRYTWLPQYITKGDFSVRISSTNTERAGTKGELAISGFFESTEQASRGVVGNAVVDLINLFNSHVLHTIENETRSGEDVFWIEEREHTYEFHLGRSRVDFGFRWEIHGTFQGGLHDNSIYTAGVVLAWLGDYADNEGKEIYNPGPYGGSKVCGLSGKDDIESPIIIDFDEKAEKHETVGFWDAPGHGEGETGGGGKTEGRSHSQESTKYLSFRQAFDYKIDQGIRSYPALGAESCEVVQQISHPQIYLTVTGEVERQETPPDVPLPPYPVNPVSGVGPVTGRQAILLSSSVEPEAPTGFGRYKLSYQYVLKLLNPGLPDNLESGFTFRWPWSPFYDAEWSSEKNRQFQNWSFPN